MAQADTGKELYLTQHYSGNGRGISTGKLLPSDWRLVSVTITTNEKNTLVLEIHPIVREGADGSLFRDNRNTS